MTAPTQMPSYLGGGTRAPQSPHAAFVQTKQALPHAQSINKAVAPAIEAAHFRAPPRMADAGDTARTEARTLWPSLGVPSVRPKWQRPPSRRPPPSASAAAAQHVSLAAWAQALSAHSSPPSATPAVPPAVALRRAVAHSETVDVEASLVEGAGVDFARIGGDLNSAALESTQGDDSVAARGLVLGGMDDHEEWLRRAQRQDGIDSTSDYHAPYAKPRGVRPDVGVALQLFDDESLETRSSEEWMALATPPAPPEWLGRRQPPPREAASATTITKAAAMEGDTADEDVDGILRTGGGGQLQARALLWDAMGSGHWCDVLVHATHPASNTYLVMRTDSAALADGVGDEYPTGMPTDWRQQPLQPPPPPSQPGASLPVDERANLYGGGVDGIVGLLEPPAGHDEPGDGRGGFDRAPWEEPRSEMVLARARGAWVHRCRLQLRGELAGVFMRRLLSAHEATERAHRLLALQLAAEFIPTDGTPTLPTAWADGIGRRIGSQLARRGGRRHGTHGHARPDEAATRAALLAEVAIDYQAVHHRILLASAISSGASVQENDDEEEGAAIVSKTTGTRRAPVGKVVRRAGGLVAQSFCYVEPSPPPPTDWLQQELERRERRGQHQLNRSLSSPRAQMECTAMFGSLCLLRPHEMMPVAPAKPGPPVCIPERAYGFDRARSAMSHAGSIHITLTSGHANVSSYGVWLCAFAAQAGDLDALRWLHSRGCIWNESVCAKAAEGGQLATLRYVRSMQCAWSVQTCAAAASAGAWDCLRWAREHGCPWDQRTTASAIAAGHLDLYLWAVNEGCAVNPTTQRRAQQLQRERKGKRPGLPARSATVCW